MNPLSRFALAIASAAAVGAAHADLVDASFTGTVSAQQGTGLAGGSAVSGAFIYDTAASRYLSFAVGDRSVMPDYTSAAAFSPDMNSALYQAQVSPLDGGFLNSTFSLDLEALNLPWSATDAIGLLGDTAQLAGNLDTGNSTFGFYTARADGTDIQSMTADLTHLRITRTAAAVPEPETWALLLAGIGVLGWVQRRMPRG